MHEEHKRSRSLPQGAHNLKFDTSEKIEEEKTRGIRERICDYSIFICLGFIIG